jgi:hypothetical protein
MFNDIRNYVKLVESCSQLTYPYPNPDLVNKDDSNVDPNYYTDPHICVFDYP